MNIYLFLILVIIIGSWVLETSALYLNMKNLSPEVPPEFKGVFTKGGYAKTISYLRENMKLDLWQQTCLTAIYLVFILAGGFADVDRAVTAYGFGTVISGIMYFLVLGLASDIVSMPFELLQTFGIEDKYGFNKTTPLLYITDKLKGYGLALVLAVPIMALIIWFFEVAGGTAWLWCWLAAIAFSMAVQYVAPTWILPLFNKFTPLSGPLRDKIDAYAHKQGYDLDGIFVMDGSKRSAKSNAFFTGMGKKKRIALYDTLMSQLSDEEIVAVLAHEVGHYKKKHILKSMGIAVVKTGFIFFLLGFFIKSQGLAQAFGLAEPKIYAGMIFFTLLYAPISLVTSIAMNKVSRKHEFEADAYAATTTGTSEDLISALKKLSETNMANLSPHKLTVALSYSHPPVLERIKALEHLEGK